MNRQKRLANLERTTISVEDSTILELWEADWANGVFDYLDEDWQPGQPPEHLAKLAWRHHATTGPEYLRDLEFPQFWEVYVRGIDPAFL
jgi:hypothetical protein